MLQFRTGMNGRQFLALLNSKPIQFFQFNTKTAAATLALQKQQARQFWHNSSVIASSMPALDVQQEEATAKNEEFSNKEKDKIEVEQRQLEEAVKQTKPKTESKPIQKEFVVGPKIIAKGIYPRLAREKLCIKYEMGRSGQKFLHLGMKLQDADSLGIFSKILVPEDVFGFVRAMDKVFRALHANGMNIIEVSPNQKDKLILYTTKAKGTNYDYRLELRIFNNSVQVLMLTMQNEHKPEHKPKNMFVPLHQFHWLRHVIGELFAENGEDVRWEFGKPPPYPDWLDFDGIPLLLPKRNQLQQRPVNPTNPSHLQFTHQQGIRQPPSSNSVGYNNQNQYNFNRNLLPNNPHNMQSSQPQEMQFDQRQLPQRVAPIQPQPAQPQMPPSPSSSSSSSSPMSQQLLQLVFLQQQQLQQIQSAILGKMEVINQEYNNSYNQRVVQPAAGMQYNGINSGQAMDYGNTSMQFMDRNNNYYDGNEQSEMQYNGRTGLPMDYEGARTATPPRMAMQYENENRTNNYGYDYRSAPQPAPGMQYNNGKNSNLGQAMDYGGRMRIAPRMASPQLQEERISNNYNSNMVRPEMQFRGEWQRNAARRNMNGTKIDQNAFNRQSSREARNTQSENLNKNPQQVDRKPDDCPYFSQLLDDYQ